MKQAIANTSAIARKNEKGFEITEGILGEEMMTFSVKFDAVLSRREAPKKIMDIYHDFFLYI